MSGSKYKGVSSWSKEAKKMREKINSKEYQKYLRHHHKIPRMELKEDLANAKNLKDLKRKYEKIKASIVTKDEHKSLHKK